VRGAISDGRPYRDNCKPDTEWEVGLGPPMSGLRVIQDLSGNYVGISATPYTKPCSLTINETLLFAGQSFLQTTREACQVVLVPLLALGCENTQCERARLVRTWDR
jgi:hypothetical protein